MTKLTDKERKELEKKIAEGRKVFQQGFDAHKLYFFNTPLLPANPLQAELLEAWSDLSYEVFTYTGANRIGKTAVSAILIQSILQGKWPWNNKKIHFPHNEPRKVRWVGQDWSKHIKTVLIPTLYEWWPKDRPVKIKKDGLGIETFWIDEITGSTLEIMSNKQESDLMEGWWGDLIVYDEPPKRDVRVACSRGFTSNSIMWRTFSRFQESLFIFKPSLYR